MDLLELSYDHWFGHQIHIFCWLTRHEDRIASCEDSLDRLFVHHIFNQSAGKSFDEIRQKDNDSGVLLVNLVPMWDMSRRSMVTLTAIPKRGWICRELFVQQSYPAFDRFLELINI